jgi:hypothetical protein
LAYTNLGFFQPVPNDPAVANIWGTLLNTNDTLIDGNLAGILNLSVAGSSNVVLTFTPGSATQTTKMVFNLTGVLTGNIYVLFPAGVTKPFIVQNNATGAFSLSIGVNNGSGGPASSTVTVPQAGTVLCYSDGINIVQVFTGIFAPLANPAFTGTVEMANPLGIAYGGTGETTAAAALTALGGAPLASPSFTGTVTFPDGSNWNSTRLAVESFLGFGALTSSIFSTDTILALNAANNFLYLTGSAAGGLQLAGDGGEHQFIDLSGSSSGAITFGTATANRGVFAADGSFIVGSTTGTGTAGEIAATNDVISFYSDMRLKTKRGPVTNATEKLMSLDVFYYEPNARARKLGYKKERRVGISAQQLEKILPEAITSAPVNGNLKRKLKNPYKTVKWDQVTPLLIATIKEQEKRIRKLERMLAK